MNCFYYQTLLIGINIIQIRNPSSPITFHPIFSPLKRKQLLKNPKHPINSVSPSHRQRKTLHYTFPDFLKHPFSTMTRRLSPPKKSFPTSRITQSSSTLYLACRSHPITAIDRLTPIKKKKEKKKPWFFGRNGPRRAPPWLTHFHAVGRVRRFVCRRGGASCAYIYRADGVAWCVFRNRWHRLCVFLGWSSGGREFFFCSLWAWCELMSFV